MTDAAKRLKEKTGKAKLSILPYGWNFEELLANQNQELVNNGNGRKRQRLSQRSTMLLVRIF